jgi:hypothetical protein
LVPDGVPFPEMSDVEFLVGQKVVDVQDGGRIVFVAGARPEPRLYADVGDCECVDADGTAVALVDLVQRTVGSASTTNGVLALRFTDGVVLRCPPDPQYEAWQVVGGSPQYLVVCLPGGELGVWDKRHVPSDAEAQRTVEQLHDLFGWKVRVSRITDDGGIIVEPVEPNDVTDL